MAVHRTSLFRSVDEPGEAETTKYVEAWIKKELCSRPLSHEYMAKSDFCGTKQGLSQKERLGEWVGQRKHF